MRRLIGSGIIVLFLGVLFNGTPIIGQELGSADVQFELEAYDLAIEAYEAHLELNPTDEHAILKLATAYERQNDLIRSARWFEKLFVLNVDRRDEEKIAFAKVLRSLGLIEQARELLQSCNEIEKAGLVSYHLDACTMAEYMLQQEDMYQLYLFYPSTEQADFSPSSWNDQLVFASFDSNEGEKVQDDLTLFHNASNKLYRSPLTRKAQKADVKMMGTESFHKEGISSCSFSSNGKKVLYTLNNFKNANRQISGKEKGLSVYLADVDESGDFLNDYALPFNSTDHSVAFACFGEDENTIYFSANSTRDNNDFDLFQVEYDGLNWGQAVSLGEQINTEGNEITPYYHKGYLYFSSDLLPGLGGYDVFRARVVNGKAEGIENMGKGINSISDDMYLIQSEPGEYYFSSNRLGGKGSYDIYVAVENGLIQPGIDALAGITETENPEIPKAVSLEQLKDQNGKYLNLSNAGMVAYNDNTLAPKDLSLAGAVKVSYGEVIKSSSMVYFIQLASFSTSKGNVRKFKELVTYGNVYRVRKTNSYKIRLGYFQGKDEARSILTQVKQAGFKDAFIVEDVLNVKELELLISSFTFSENDKYVAPEVESEYKVRLAAYSNPLYFNTEKVKDLGVIEQWSKGQWTIFILSGYESLEAAKKARIKAENRGFTGAEIVMDDNGVLTRVHEN